jgi:hypothetical protein
MIPISWSFLYTHGRVLHITPFILAVNKLINTQLVEWIISKTSVLGDEEMNIEFDVEREASPRCSTGSLEISPDSNATRPNP